MCEGDNPASLEGGLGQLLQKARKIAKVKHETALTKPQIQASVEAPTTRNTPAPRLSNSSF